MTRAEAIKMLTAKAECMKRDISGFDEDCNSHRCGECNLCYEQGNMGEQVEYLQMAIKALEEPQWILCSERLPAGQTEVIVSVLDTSGDTLFDYTASGWITTDGEYWIVDNEICSYVIAWCEFPEPYRKKGGME